MKKLIFLTFALFLGVRSLVFAESTPISSSAPAARFCPISGDKANKKVSYVYQGKTYYFCCPKRVKYFKKDPERFLSESNLKNQ